MSTTAVPDHLKMINENFKAFRAKPKNHSKYPFTPERGSALLE